MKINENTRSKVIILGTTICQLVIISSLFLKNFVFERTYVSTKNNCRKKMQIIQKFSIDWYVCVFVGNVVEIINTFNKNANKQNIIVYFIMPPHSHTFVSVAAQQLFLSLIKTIQLYGLSGVFIELQDA